MFTTLLGALPRPPLPVDAPRDALVEAAIRAQESAGMDPVTDGGPPTDRDLARAWTASQRLTDHAAKQAVAGPYTAARDGTPAGARSEATLHRATALNALLRDLAAAGCPLIEIHEPAAIAMGTDDAERALFREAHLRLLDGIAGSHLSLALTGGNAETAWVETLLAAPYISLAVDLIAGPDNWRLVAAAPGDLGIVCGVVSPSPHSDDRPEPLLWAAAYAASTGGRGPARVGLATASSFAELSWDVAVRKLERLGEAGRLVDAAPEARLQSLDPRAVSSRSAALGRVDLPPSHVPDPGADPT
jgi:methionine synthase II (cobalamin-independent)